MKKILFILMVTFSVGAWAGVALAADPPGVPKPAPQVTPPPETMRTAGTVELYVKGKKIKVATSGGALNSFNIVSETVIKGELKKGARVTVIYQKERDKLVATSIVESRR